MVWSDTFRQTSFIKSIQRGVITMTAGNGSATATISSVDTAKSFLSFGGSSHDDTADSNARQIGKAVLTNATTVTATREGTLTNTLVAYEVIEFV